MIGYATIGTNDLTRAVGFYDALFETIGVRKLWQHGNMAAWGASRDDVALCIARPFDGQRATPGNGNIIALKMKNFGEVDAIHAKCLALGGTDEGGPGQRGDHGFYGGYFRDLDGNKLNAYVPASG